MSEKVVLGVDNRAISEPVVRWITERALLDEPLDIEIVSVADVGWVPAGASDVEYRNAYEQALWESVEALRARIPGVPVETTLLWGLPGSLLVDASARADLLVLAGDRAGFVQGLVSGTLPLRVAARSRCPVVVVPAEHTPAPHAHHGRRVVLGVSLDSSDDQAVEFAGREATRYGYPLHIVHAVPLPQSLLVEDLISDDPVDELLRAGGRMLDTTVAEVQARHPHLAVTSSTPRGRTVESLDDESRDAAMLVVGSRGRGPVGSVVLGSVSHDVLRNPPCVVAVVPHARARTSEGGTGS